jgi:hypothetical protein
MELRRSNVRDAYRNNLNILLSEPETYWREVEASIMMSRFFRFHVSGDIPDTEYLQRMVAITARNPHCEVLCFTKRYEMVNALLDSGAVLPQNLHLIFSGWRGLEMCNPHGLPEAHVLYRDGTTTARPDALLCEGDCTRCAITDDGCWSLRPGEQVVFHEH